MKLRNKKTGEVIQTQEIYENLSGKIKIRKDGEEYDSQVCEYNSLAELNAEWEDYEEPKDIWWLDNEGCVNHASGDVNDSFRKNRKIGNYFLSREEAEKAVEKLKAWKRLKDKGIEFYGWRKNPTGTYDFLARWKGVPPKIIEIIDDLDLLFGGEE